MPDTPAPSTLHLRLEELLGLLVQRHVPRGVFSVIGNLGKVLPMLGVLGVHLPPLPADLPRSPAELMIFIRHELRQRPAAELAQVIALAERTTAAWLVEYTASQTPAAPEPTDEEPIPDGRDAEPATIE